MSLLHMAILKPKKKKFSELATEFHPPSTHLFIYHQAFSFITYSYSNASKIFHTSILDRLIENGTYSISVIYKFLLQAVHTTSTNTLYKGWQKYFPEEDLGDNILEGNMRMHKCIINELWRVQTDTQGFYPIFSGDIAKSVTCSQYRIPKPTLLHHFWQCAPISTFWDQIVQFIFNITGYHTAKMPILRHNIFTTTASGRTQNPYLSMDYFMFFSCMQKYTKNVEILFPTNDYCCEKGPNKTLSRKTGQRAAELCPY